MTAMKWVRIKVAVAGSEHEPIEVDIAPGVTAGEVLAALGLDQSMTLWGRDRLAIAGDAELWSRIQGDGQMLYAAMMACCLY